MQQHAGGERIGADLVLRPARPAEAALLSAIAAEAKRHWGYAQADLDAWRDALTVSPQQIEAQPTWVAELAGQPVGFFCLAPGAAQAGRGDPPRTDAPAPAGGGAPPSWELDHLWVRPPFIGRGLGSALLERAMLLARQGGAQQLTIDADPNAAAFYRRHGAVQTHCIAAPVSTHLARRRPQLVLVLVPDAPAAAR